MLYYCVCLEASSLVISGQPICLFFPSIPHHCTSALYCLPLSVQSCSTVAGFLNIGFFFYYPQKRPQYIIFLTVTLSPCVTLEVFCYIKSLRTELQAQSRCLPAWPVPLLHIYSAYSEALSVHRVHLNSAKECSVIPLRLHTRVCAVHSYLMCVFLTEL